MAVEKRVTSPLMEPNSIEKILEVDSHIGEGEEEELERDRKRCLTFPHAGCAMSGLIADSRTMVDKARVEAQVVN